ncbi:MAG TPA: four helix bundle protein [Gemmatimonadaceae bacterium]
MIDYRRLTVWQQAHAFSIEVYRITRLFPSEERFALAIQLRRASISIESTLAEGSARAGDRAFASFVEIAAGSAAEAECQLRLANDLGFIEPGADDALAESIRAIRAMLGALRARLRTTTGEGLGAQ